MNYGVSSSLSWFRFEENLETGSYVASSFVHGLASEHNLVFYFIWSLRIKIMRYLMKYMDVGLL